MSDVHTQEKQPLGLPDRVVKITGSPDQLLRAVALLLTKLVESPNYTRFTTSNVSYGPPLAPVRPTFCTPFADSHDCPHYCLCQELPIC